LPFLSVKTIAREIGWSERKVQRRLKDLIAEADDRDAKRAMVGGATNDCVEGGDDDEHSARKPLYLGLLKRVMRWRKDGSRTADAFDFSPLFAKLKEMHDAQASDNEFGQSAVDDMPESDDDDDNPTGGTVTQDEAPVQQTDPNAVGARSADPSEAGEDHIGDAEPVEREPSWNVSHPVSVETLRERYYWFSRNHADGKEMRNGHLVPDPTDHDLLDAFEAASAKNPSHAVFWASRDLLRRLLGSASVERAA